MKIKKGIAFAIVVCGYAGMLSAQKNTVSGGGDVFGPGGQVNYSIGQIDYKPIYSIGGQISAGNQQAYVVDVSGVFENNLSNFITVYPNPASDAVFILVGELEPTAINYTILSLDGKIVLQGTLSSAIESLPVQDLAMGSYVVLVFNGQEKIKSFNLIKN